MRRGKVRKQPTLTKTTDLREKRSCRKTNLDLRTMIYYLPWLVSHPLSSEQTLRACQMCPVYARDNVPC